MGRQTRIPVHGAFSCTTFFYLLREFFINVVDLFFHEWCWPNYRVFVQLTGAERSHWESYGLRGLVSRQQNPLVLIPLCVLPSSMCIYKLLTFLLFSAAIRLSVRIFYKLVVNHYRVSPAVVTQQGSRSIQQVQLIVCLNMRSVRYVTALYGHSSFFILCVVMQYFCSEAARELWNWSLLGV